MSGKVIGIDLGTTNSCVAVVENGEAVIVPNQTGSRTTPSVVGFKKNGERIVGETAKRQAVTNPERTISSIKRQMGTQWTKRIDDREYRPQTISAMILMQLKKDAESFIGEEVTEAVITVPAYFNDAQRQATKDAGRIAGLNVLRIVNEPTSAALSYGLNHGEPSKVMVYDLGGGTFDVSVIEIGESVIEVLSTAGDNHLGGDDFDRRVADWITDSILNQQGVDVTGDVSAMQRIRDAAETAKKDLSSSPRAQIVLPYLTQVRGEPIHADLTLDIGTFRGLISDLVDRTEGPVRQALCDAGISPRELNRVLLVGGSTRIPLVQEKVRKMTGTEPSRNINPDECVAQGAAVLGYNLSSASLVHVGPGAHKGPGTGILLLDVTPMSLAIETVGGVATKLLDRNTTLPVKYSKIFSTAMPFQTSVEINVLQGERPMARDNKKIGTFKLKGIRRAMAGVPKIEVTFDIDTNGILKVSAKDLESGKEQSITITADDRMSEAEIEQAIRDAALYASVDAVRRKALDLIAESSSLLAKTEQMLKESGDSMEKEKKKRLKNECRELSKQIAKCKVDKITEEQVAELRAAKEQLERTLSWL